jgi:hypothetical protein
MLAAGFAPAKAAIITFTAAGAFSDGTILGGTITIDGGFDMINGFILSGNLTLTGVSGSYDSIFDQHPNFARLYQVDFTDISQGNQTQSQLQIMFQDGIGLLGYKGGNLCSTTDLCLEIVGPPIGPASDYFVNASVPIQLVSGTLTESTEAPEPQSLLLAFGGFAGLLAFVRVTRSRNSPPAYGNLR